MFYDGNNEMYFYEARKSKLFRSIEKHLWEMVHEIYQVRMIRIVIGYVATLHNAYNIRYQ